jgi:hypothetical protein
MVEIQTRTCFGVILCCPIGLLKFLWRFLDVSTPQLGRVSIPQLGIMINGLICKDSDLQKHYDNHCSLSINFMSILCQVP